MAGTGTSDAANKYGYLSTARPQRLVFCISCIMHSWNKLVNTNVITPVVLVGGSRSKSSMYGVSTRLCSIHSAIRRSYHKWGVQT